MADKKTVKGNKKTSSGRAGTGSRSSLNRTKSTGKSSGRQNASGRSGVSGSRSTKSTRPGNASRGASRPVQQYQTNPAMNTEIFCWSLLVVAVLIFLSLLGVGGRIGNALGSIFFGLMGTNAYVFPFLLFFLTIFVMVNRGNRKAYIQTASCVGLFVVVCGLLELMIVGWRESHDLMEYYDVGKQYHEGGGLIGGALENLFCPTIGVIGTYLVLIVAVILFIALITQKTLFVSAGHRGREAWRDRQEISAARREEERARRDEERELRRAERRREQEEEAARRREEEKKRFSEASRLEPSEDETDSAEDSDRLSLSFFRNVKKKTDSLLSGDSRRGDGLSVSTDLFGDTKKSGTGKAGSGIFGNGKAGSVIFGTGKKGAGDGRSRLQEGDVVFGKLSGDVPDKSNAPDTSFDGSVKKNKVVSSKTVGESAVVFSRKNLDRMKYAHDTHDEEPYEAQGTSKSSVSDEASILSPDLVIHRGGQITGQSGAEGIKRREEEDVPWSEAEDTEVSGAAGGAVTKKQIEEAGAFSMRRKAAGEKETQTSRGGGIAGSHTSPAGSSSGPAGESIIPKKTTAAEAEQAANNVAKEIESREEEQPVPYTFPDISLLRPPKRSEGSLTDEDLRETAARLQQILATFGVSAKVTNVSCGPSVTRYELQPEMGTKVSKITNLADDIKMNLAVTDIRIEAPIPGKAAVGIEVPNKTPSMVCLRELIDSDEFRRASGKKLTYVVGKDIAGKIVISDIAKMPHLLIAGATGSGKSVFINTMIMSIIYNADPNEVKMIMIDPKVVELSVYNGIPHLFIPVVTDPKKAAGALNWAVAEMTRRYQVFAEVGVRNLAGYNAKVETLEKAGVESAPKKLPQIVIIVDELADLMMVSGNEVEDAICRLAQLARACGIHLVIATQRPSVDVITGLIKANIPSRIAFAVSSGTDSRTILDRNGAERLLGNGDMLFSPQNYKNPVRVQGAYVSDEEIQDVVDAIKVDGDPEKMKARMAEVQKAASSAGGGGNGPDDVDELFADAGRFIISKDKASIGMLQRWLKIGFNRAARIMDQLSDAEVVGPDEGTKPRKVLMSEEQFEEYLENH